jgi:phage protein D
VKITLGMLIGSRESPQPAPQPLLEALQRVRVTQGDGGRQGDYQQGFELTLRAERGPGASSDYALLADPLLDPGNRLIVSVTLDATPHVLFDGIIAHRQLSPEGVTGEPGLTLMGKDISLLMDLEEQDLDYPGQGDDAIARSILGRYARYGIHAQISSPAESWTPAEDERVARQLTTDRQYLQRLAARHGFIFRIKPGPTPRRSIGYWGPLEYGDSPQKALSVNMGAATNVESLTFAEDALAPTQVFGAVYNEQDPEPTPISIEQSSQSTPLVKSPRLTADPSFVRKRRLVYSGASAAEAQALAQAMTDRSTQAVLRVTGSLDTLQYGQILVAPGVVGLRGAGFRHDGDYYVRQVTHDIGQGEYKQRFELTREGLGSTIQRVEP